MPQMASVSVGVWVGVGGRYEPRELGGISHFIEHMLFKGTTHRTAAEISQGVEGIGGYLNAFTDEEHTCFYARAHSTRLPDLLDVLLDMFLHSRFSPTEIGKERDVIKEEIAMYRDQPAEHVHDLLNALEFPGHPLGRPVIGRPATLDRIQRRHFLDYLKSHYVSGATVIAAAGSVVHDELVALLRPWEGKFRAGPRPSFNPVTPRPPSTAIKVATRKVEQTNLGLGLRTCSRHDPARFALRLLNVLLGENMSSRLFQVVREEHGLTYNIQSSLSFWDDCGDLVISAGLDTGELQKTVRLILGELQRLRRRPPGSREFERARDYVLGQIDLHLESTENHMMTLGEGWLGLGRIVSPDETKKRIREVTPTEVWRVAQSYLTASNLSLALVTPSKSTGKLESLLGDLG